MSNEKLTDGDLRALMEMALNEGSGACAMDGVTLGKLVRELQDRRLAEFFALRQAALSEEDVEALRDLKDWIRYRVEDRISAGAERRSLPVLVRILEASK